MDKDITSFLLNLLQTKGSDLQYGNEKVTQLEHALQCAELTEKNNCSKEIITLLYYMILAICYMMGKIQYIKEK